MRKAFLILFAINSFLAAQVYISPGIFGDSLAYILINEYKTSSTLGYNNARDTMYAVIDNNQGLVHGVYSNFSVELIFEVDPSIAMYEGGINCEHVWPQSMGAGTEPMKSDLHHLFPCKDNINSSRSNNPYGEISDNLTDYWFYLDTLLENIPQDLINHYSESYTSSSNDLFEPRENRKGDIARSIFYFKTMYDSVADEEFFNLQKDILFDWHYYDYPDTLEISRTWKIAEYQEDIPNPFIIDPTLIWRIYFSELHPPGDINSDQVIDIMDIILIINHILEYTNLNKVQLHQSDMNSDFNIDILDIMIIINLILN